MINYTDEFKPALLSLRNILKQLRYDWIYRSIKGLSYFADSSLSGIAPAINDQLANVSLKHNIAIRLLALGQVISETEIKEIFSDELTGELLRLGLLIQDNNNFLLDGYRVIPWLGFYIISTDPVTQPDTNLTAEEYRLASDLMNPIGKTAIDLNCGSGLVSLVAAEKLEKVFAFSDNLTAINIANANVMLNDLAERVFVSKLPSSLLDLPKVDLVFSSYSQLPLPKTIEDLFDGKLIAKNSLKMLSELKNIACNNIKIITPLLGQENVRDFTNYLENLLKDESLEIKAFILSRSYISPLYIDTLSQIINYQLQHLQISTDLSQEGLLDELQKYYKSSSADCIYLVLIEVTRLEVAEKTAKFELVNFASDLTSQDKLDLPKDIELIEKELLILKTTNIHLQISEIEKTIIELIKEEDTILLREIAEKLATRHNISFETAGAKTIEFCHQLFLQGLLSTPAMSSLRGQMRQMTLNVNKFASALTSIGKELDQQSK